MKTWFITGTSAGLGRILTEKLLARGHRVAATVRKPEALNNLKQQYGEQLWVATLDVTDTAKIKEVMKKAFDSLGQMDVIVNNAGYALFCAAEEASDEQIMHQVNTNIIGSMQVIEAYDKTPAGDVRRAMAAGNFPIKGNVNKTVQAIIDCVEVTPAPLRLALGGDAYRDMRASLEVLDNQKDLALASEMED